MKPLDAFKETSEGFPATKAGVSSISRQNMILLCIYLTRDYHVSSFLGVPAAFMIKIGYLRQNNLIFDRVGFNICKGDTTGYF